MKLKQLTRTFIIASSIGLGLGLSPITFSDSANKYQKPGAQIRISDPEMISLDIAKQKQVKVAFNAPSAGQLFITAKPKPGLTLATSHPEWHFDLATEKPEVTLNIEGQTNGKFYVMFHARIIEKNNTSSRVFGIPVQVGDVSALEAKIEKPKEKKEYVIMKAEEKVSR